VDWDEADMTSNGGYEGKLLWIRKLISFLMNNDFLIPIHILQTRYFQLLSDHNYISSNIPGYNPNN